MLLYINIFVTSATKICTEVSNAVLHIFAVPIIGIVAEEIMMHNIAHAHQHIGGYPLAFKKVVDVLPRIAQLAGKPRYSALLPCKFCPY